MSAVSTVGDVFTDPEFAAPGNSLWWGLGGLDDTCRERTRFLIMPKRPYEWRVDAHGCYKFDNADTAVGPRDTMAHIPVFLHLRTTNFPGIDSVARSEQAQQRRTERKATKHERRRSRRRLTQPSAHRLVSTVLTGKHRVRVFPAAAADSEVLHLRAADSDLASTETPADDDHLLFSREEVSRLDARSATACES